MNRKLYVGNFPWETSEDDLGQFFTQVGEVEKVEIINDRHTGKSRGFGFVTMKTEEKAESALKVLHGKIMGGRDLTVREARPERADRGGYDETKSPEQTETANSNKHGSPSLSQQIQDFCLGDCMIHDSLDFSVEGKGFNLERTS